MLAPSQSRPPRRRLRFDQRRKLSQRYGRHIFRLLVLPPFDVDGDLDQRFALGQLLGKLLDTRDRLSDVIDDVQGVLRSLMGAKKTYTVHAPSYTIRLKPEFDYRCVLHSCPPAACSAMHPGGNVVVRKVATGYRYWSVSGRQKFQSQNDEQ